MKKPFMFFTVELIVQTQNREIVHVFAYFIYIVQKAFQTKCCMYIIERFL